MNVALVGSVSSSWYALDALVRAGIDVTCCLGLDESQAARISDYRSLRHLAHDGGIPFRSFARITDDSVATMLQTHRPDLLWVIGLSQLVPGSIREMARHGAVGFHPTMLPEGRGRAPVAWTILLNRRAAVNLFYLTDEPDAGDIIIQREVPVYSDDYSQDLIQRTNYVLGDVIAEIAPAIRSGVMPRTPQDHSQATVYAKRTPQDGLVDWNQSATDIYRLIRAAGRPYPGAFSFLGTTKVMIWRGKPLMLNSDRQNLDVGKLMENDGRRLVQCNGGAIELEEIEIPDGRCFNYLTLQHGTFSTNAAICRRF